MDVKKRKATVPWIMMMMFILLFSGNFSGCSQAASQRPNKKKSTHPKAASGFGSSVLFPVTGNVYPLGYYSIWLAIGQPPKVFEFDIDTGSDITWVQCDAPCTGCTKPVDQLYKPDKNILVPCNHPSCGAVHFPESPRCEKPDDQCDFEVDYVDHGSVMGVVVNDFFSLRLMNGSLIRPLLTFGCAYNLQNPGPYPPPSTAGVVGLGNGKASILSQLQSFGLTRNVLGHCLSGKGGGFLFLGDDLVPSGIAWLPVSAESKHYLSSPAELLFGGKPTGIKDLKVVFDSGSSYTYFCSRVYKALLDLVSRGLNRKPLNSVQDKALPVCWKGKKPFKSVHDVRNYFSSLTLSFTNTGNIQLQLQPEAYLIVTEHGNACLGILNGTEAGLEDSNIIGVGTAIMMNILDHMQPILVSLKRIILQNKLPARATFGFATESSETERRKRY
ncbi:aspartic proteinase Asp1-like isoform X2 [Durio zibethinus]|uniref:Aspartic proteinase Asp1-like isoform X2 n=1 Tax=Durio zibethinus TaxID=66656 RepID=A0A6P6B7X7_DURZI|nr:aspartic proteinase Asp1-like isoform X2 [Durio zibethinus]